MAPPDVARPSARTAQRMEPTTTATATAAGGRTRREETIHERHMEGSSRGEVPLRAASAVPGESWGVIGTTALPTPGCGTTFERKLPFDPSGLRVIEGGDGDEGTQRDGGRQCSRRERSSWWRVVPSTRGTTAAPAVKGVGAMQCTVSGKVKFNPALSSTSTPTAVKVSFTLTGCHGSNAGKTVSGGQVTGTLTGTPTGDCGVSQFSTSGSLTVTYTVKSGHPKLTPTTLSFNTVQAVENDTVEGQVNGTVTAGSISRATDPSPT